MELESSSDSRGKERSHGRVSLMPMTVTMKERKGNYGMSFLVIVLS